MKKPSIRLALRPLDPCHPRCHGNPLECPANFSPNLRQNGEEKLDHAPVSSISDPLLELRDHRTIFGN